MTEREYQERLDFERTDDRLRCNQLREEGEAKGKAEGLVQGKAEGLAQGEAKKQKEIVLAMLKENMPYEMIKKITNLSTQEIEEIKK